jgi:hypothetical protein
MREWKKGDEITAARLNDMRRGDPVSGGRGRDSGHGNLVHYVQIISVTETGVEDANGNPVQWTYEVHEAYKTGRGYSTAAAPTWTILPEGAGFRGTAYNHAEDGNTGTGEQGNMVDHDGADYPDGFEMKPLIIGRVYPCRFILVSDGSGGYVQEAWIFTVPNGEDGTCAA